MRLIIKIFILSIIIVKDNKNSHNHTFILMY